jgi:hypothetical protein
MAKHTPGPWTTSAYGQYLGGKRGKLTIIALNPAKIVAEDVDPTDGLLIAAAPDLLVACQAALMMPIPAPRSKVARENIQVYRKVFREAIAKATNETPPKPNHKLRLE